MRRVLAVAAVLIAVIAMIAFETPGADAEDETPLPQDLYPDADAIISQGPDGSIQITLRDPGSESGYVTRAQRSGTSVKLIDLSDVGSAFKAVMIGGTVGDLTLVTITTYSADRFPVDVSFEQISGSINHLRAVEVSPGTARALPDDYYAPFSPIGSLSISLSGRVAELCPTKALIGVASIDISIDGGTVDRLYPTGENGHYGSVSVVMNGGTVGYMSHQSAVADSVSYRFIRGTVEYLCLGADSEGGSGYYRTNLWTFYAIRDVDVVVEVGVTVGRVILGAGILDRPSVLCNSQAPTFPTTRNVSIYVDGAEVSADRAFLACDSLGAASDGKIYRFQSYTVGSAPSVSSIRSTYYHNYQPRSVYGDDGIWPSAGGADISTGTVAYLQADLVVRAGAAANVLPGATAVVACRIAVYGSLINSGYVDNGGLIEERDSGIMSGNDPEGRGFVAQAIYSSSTVHRVDVMTVTRNAVALYGYTGEINFNTALVIIERIGCTLVVSAPADLYIRGNPAVVSIEEIGAEEGWSSAWSVYVSPADTPSGSLLTMTMTVPLMASSGYAIHVKGPSGFEMEVLEMGPSGTTFALEGNGIYMFRAEPPVDPVPEPPEDGGPSLFVKNAAIAVAIVLLAAAVVYMLLRKRRGRGPS